MKSPNRLHGIETGMTRVHYEAEAAARWDCPCGWKFHADVAHADAAAVFHHEYCAEAKAPVLEVQERAQKHRLHTLLANANF